MDDKIILDAINSHMSLLSSLQSWMLVTAIATISMATSRGEELDLKFIKAKRHNAAVLVAALYVVIMVASLIAMWRIYGLLELLPVSKMGSALSAIATHSWLLNPFAYFGDSRLYRLAAWASLVGLLIVWVIAFASTSVLAGRFQRLEYLFGSVFVALGIAALTAVYQVQALLVSKTAVINPVLSSALESMQDERLRISIWGGIAATIVARAVDHLINKHAGAEHRSAVPNQGPPENR